MSLDPEPPELSSVSPGRALETAVAADQVAAHAGASGHHGPFHSHCENCHEKLAGPYCHRCGQHDFEFHRSFGHVFLEALENLFHFEGKFFRNIVTLLFQPGRLSADFNAGKRAAQMPPFRLYVFVSFIFFLLVFLGGGNRGSTTSVRASDGDTVVAASVGEAWREFARSMDGEDWKDSAKVNQAVRELAEKTSGVPPAATANPAEPTDDLPAEHVASAPAEPTVASAPAPAPRQDNGLLHYLKQQGRRLDDPAYRQRLGHSIRSHLPHMLMVCLPFLALYTRVLFRKSGQVYLQHLVVAVHFHTFIYLWILFARGWVALTALPGWGLEGTVGFLCNAWLWLYPLLMLRRLFSNSWGKTFVKTCLVAGLYTMTLGLGFIAMAAIIFFSN